MASGKVKSQTLLTADLIKNVYGGTESRFDCQIIVVGHLKAGKTTLIGRLLRKHFKMRDTGRTNGIIITHKGGMRLKKGEWITTEYPKDSVQAIRRMKSARAKEDYTDDPSDITDAAINAAIEAYEAYIPSDSQKDEGPTCRVHFMDFAGQSVFNSTHQMFMTHRAIYLLVLDISRSLESEVEDDDVYCIGTNRRMSVQELTEFLLSSIHVYSGEEPDSYPKVLLVGTHKDLVEETTASDRMKRIITKFEGTPLQKHLVDDFIVDCSIENDPEMDKLRQSIFQIAEKEPHWGEETPTRWLPLENEIINKRDKGVRVLTLQTLREMNKECFAKIQSDDEFQKFLHFNNDLGNLMYFGGTAQHVLVILDPQWLIDALKQIITHAQFFPTLKNVEDDFKDFTECAKLSKELITAVWSENEDKTFITHMEQLIIILEQTDIIATPLTYNKDGKAESSRYYFVPTMLKPNPDGKAKIDSLLRDSRSKSPPLCFVFNDKFLQPAIFPRLQAECTSIYKIKEAQSQPLMFYKMAVFQLSRELDLVLEHVEHIIRITVINERGTEISPKICESVRLTIEDALRKIVRLYGHNTEPFTTAVQSEEGFINLDDVNTGRTLDLASSARKNNIEKIGPWIMVKESENKERRISKGHISARGTLGFVHLGRLARRVRPEDLLIAARTEVAEEDIDHARIDNKDNSVAAVYDVLVKWKKMTDSLTLQYINEALLEPKNLQEAVADTDTSEYFKGFDPAFLDKEVNDETADRISRSFPKLYRFLALELGIDHTTIETVVQDFPTVTSRAKELLTEWRTNLGSRATYREIGQAILEVETDIHLLKEFQ